MDQPKTITVKLSQSEAWNLDDLCKTNELNISDMVRECIELCSSVTRMREYAAKPAVRKKQARKATDFDHRLVDHYQEVFDDHHRVFWPSVISTIRAAQEKGVSDADLIGIVSVAPLDPWVQQKVQQGDTPRLHQLLSEAMIGRMLPLIDSTEEKAEVARQLHLRGTVKPKAVQDLKEFADADMQSVAYDLIQEAKTQEQVHEIISAALDKQLDKYIAKMGAKSE